MVRIVHWCQLLLASSRISYVAGRDRFQAILVVTGLPFKALPTFEKAGKIFVNKIFAVAKYFSVNKQR
jgi:hypothetical protein